MLPVDKEADAVVDLKMIPTCVELGRLITMVGSPGPGMSKTNRV